MSRLVLISVLLSASTVSAQLRVVTLPSANNAPAPAESTSGDPLLLRPGHYVLPSPYAADNFSPHLRPFPDYSYLRRPGSSRFQDQRAFANPGYPSCGSAFASPYPYYSYGGDVERAYNQGRYDADHEYVRYIASQRAGRLLNQYAVQFDEGVRLFREGNYEQAMVNHLGAAELNHEGAAPRLHAAHAMFAMGRYREAVPLLERAFELMPTLPYKSYDLRDEYGRREEFDEHLAALKDYVRSNPKDAAGYTLLGYVTYYTRGPGAADSILRRATSLDSRSFFIPKLTAVSSKATPGKGGAAKIRREKTPVKAKTPRPEPESGGLRVVYVGRS